MSSILTGSTIFVCSQSGGLAKPKITRRIAGGNPSMKMRIAKSGGLARSEITHSFFAKPKIMR